MKFGFGDSLNVCKRRGCRPIARQIGDRPVLLIFEEPFVRRCMSGITDPWGLELAGR
jgi:hypothetical protein